MVNDLRFVHDISGHFYAGQKIQEVSPAHGLSDRFLAIDKNKDGVLSVDEVIKSRKKITHALTGVALSVPLVEVYSSFILQGPSKYELMFMGALTGLSAIGALIIGIHTRKIEKRLAELKQTQEFSTNA